jgi:anti-sigma B factor antagonist
VSDFARSRSSNDFADGETPAGFFTEVEDGSGVVVSVNGDLDLATAPVLARRLAELLALPLDSLTIELAGVEFMDSSGLKVLNQARQGANERSVLLELASVPRCVQVVLEATNMYGLFTFR